MLYDRHAKRVHDGLELPHSTAGDFDEPDHMADAVGVSWGGWLGSLYPVYSHDGDQVLFDLIQHSVRADAQPTVGTADERSQRSRIVS